jgi:hypothetical protein
MASFRSDLPAALELPTADDVGPDPEPLGVRAGWLLERRTSQMTCILGEGLGTRTVCTEAKCPWYRVPGTTAACAVSQWAPRARRDPRVARWFVARRGEIMRGRGVR